MIWIVLTSCVLNLYSTFAGKYFLIYLELNGFFCSLVKSLTEVHFYYEMFFFLLEKKYALYTIQIYPLSGGYLRKIPVEKRGKCHEPLLIF